MKSTKSCEVLSKIVTVSFEKPDHVYKPGLPYTGTVTLGPLSLQGSPAPCCSQPCSCPPPALFCHGCSSHKWQHLPFPPGTDQGEGSRWLWAAPEAGPALGQEPGKRERTNPPDRQLRESLLPAGGLWLERQCLLAGKCPTRVPRQGSWSCFLQWSGALELHQPRGLLGGFTP